MNHLCNLYKPKDSLYTNQIRYTPLSEYNIQISNKNCNKRSIEEYESVYSEWFGKRVVLTSSGRSALHLCLSIQNNLSSYENLMYIPQYLSRCVINSLNPSVIPSLKPHKNWDSELIYHQLGYPHKNLRTNNILTIEDLAHSFYFKKNTGKREWIGDLAIFSLPKFFNTQGMSGGIIVNDEKIEEKIRAQMRINEKFQTDEIRYWMQNIFQNIYSINTEQNQLFLSCAYELLLEFTAPFIPDLKNAPCSIDEIIYIGEERNKRVQMIVNELGVNNFYSSSDINYDNFSPFSLSYLPKNDIFMIRDKLIQNNFIAAVKYFDENRNMFEPNYKQYLMLPCHHLITIDKIKEMLDVIKSTINS